MDGYDAMNGEHNIQSIAEITAENPDVVSDVEKLVTKHLRKQKADSNPPRNLLVTNVPIRNIMISTKLVTTMNKMKALCKSESQMVSVYFKRHLPIRMTMGIREDSIQLGTYNIYLL